MVKNSFEDIFNYHGGVNLEQLLTMNCLLRNYSLIQNKE